MSIETSLDLVRSKRTLYLGDEEPSPRLLAVRMIDCAIVSGASHLEVLFQDGWVVVFGETDWITPNIQHIKEPVLERAFKGLIALKGGRQNEVRFEAILAAFSKSVAVWSDSKCVVVQGNAPPAHIKNLVEGRAFGVIFEPEIE